MKHSYRIIPIYTADVSGICSALYELGGMTVIHDPSGCNSTYNTHDEIRWYDQDSLIYISGLSEIDAITGNDRKFTDAVIKAARDLTPAFVALVSSPIPYMNGTDFPALAQIIERQTGIPSFFVPSNGMHDYVQGAGAALAKIAESFVTEECHPDSRRAVNILGMTPLDFAAPGQADSLKALLAEHGWDTVSVWAMGSDLSAIRRSAAAAVNLVVSSVGLAAAKVLKRKFGTPFVVGLPTGAFAGDVFAALEQAAESKEDRYPCKNRGRGRMTQKEQLTGQQRQKPENRTGSCRSSIEPLTGQQRQKPEDRTESCRSGIEPLTGQQQKLPPDASSVCDGKPDVPSPDAPAATIIGEPVVCGSLAAAYERCHGVPLRLLCPLEGLEEVLISGDILVQGEEEAQRWLGEANTVIADPLYRPICRSSAAFFPLPHVAFSGRIYLKQMQDLTKWEEKEYGNE